MPDNLNQEYRAEIRSQAVKQAAKWTLAGAVALAVFAGTGWWLYLQPKIDDYIASKANGLPSGAVVAFLSSESETCPGADWKLYDDAKGRFIVGAGHNRESGLTFKALSETGGDEQIALTEQQVPAHRHGIPQLSITADLGWKDGGTTTNVPYFDLGPDQSAGKATVQYRSARTGVLPTGGNEPHDNMPPYIALYYCKKS